MVSKRTYYDLVRARIYVSTIRPWIVREKNLAKGYCIEVSYPLVGFDSKR